MATLLYRLGDFSRRHSRAVVITWLLILGLATAGAVGLSKPLTNTFEIPGATYQKVFDDLKREIPEASGGIGTVILSSETGPFTEEQKQAIASVTRKWSELEGVREASSSSPTGRRRSRPPAPSSKPAAPGSPPARSRSQPS